MKFIKVLFIILSGILIIGLTNLLYLPGSDSLYSFSQLSYNIIGMISIIMISIALPIGIVWALVYYVKKRNLEYPLILIIVSIFSLINTVLLTKYFREFSREYTIEETEELISAIESYKISNTEYPENLKTLVPFYIDKIPNPKIIGIKQFTYSTKDSIYELEFVQNYILNFNFEVVIYNPMSAQKGYGEMPLLYETGIKNWKYFIYD